MSFYRENVIWEASDGKWNLGFFTVVEGNQDFFDYDFNAEVEVEYDYNSFEWVSEGYTSAEDALKSFAGDTPANGNIVPQENNEELCSRYDLMAKAFLDPSVKVQAESEERKVLVSEHFKGLMKNFEESSRYADQEVVVVIKTDGEPYTELGEKSTVAGHLEKADGWLYVEGAPVFNTKSNRFHNYIHKIEISNNE